jgi:hypothetical protein
MTPFEEVYLLCDHKFALIPGPLSFDEPFYSVDLQDMEDYPSIDVVRTFSALDHVSVVSQGGEHGYDWFKWRWRWELEDRLIEWNFSVFEPEDESSAAHWGGSELTTLCTFADLVLLWNTVRRDYPAVWLHDGEDTRMYTPHSFLETFALPTLHPALSHQDESIRVRAEQELAAYRTPGLRDNG